MKTKARIVLRMSSAMMIFLLLSNVSMAPKNDDIEETIRGFVVAVEWDDEEEVTAVAISVTSIIEDPENEEEEYQEVTEDFLVADNEKGAELLKLVGEQVEATGIVKADEDGAKTILVTAYVVIEDDTN